MIPDTGGVARLFQMCGHGVAADMVLTGRPMSAEEALGHGVVSRIVPADAARRHGAWRWPTKIAAAPAVTVKMARRVLGHLAEPEVRTSMAEELIAQTFISRSDDMAELRAARAEDRDAALHGELTHDRPATAARPARAARPRQPPRCPPGTFDGTVVLVTGGGTGLGKAIATEFARLGASLVIASRKDDHLEPRPTRRSTASARPVVTVTCDIRDPDQIAAAFDQAEAEVGLPDVLVNNAAANFPVPAEDMSPNAWRTVVDITLNGTFFCSREFGPPPPRRGHARRRSSTSARPTPGPAAPASPTRPRPRPA